MLLRGLKVKKPAMSLVLRTYLEQCKEPPWTSFFIKSRDVTNDHGGQSHFNFTLPSGCNYHILRTAAFPYVKYHCTKRNYENLTLDDRFYRAIKIINLGIPQLMYGVAAIFLIRHEEEVLVPPGHLIKIYFLYKEDKGSRY